MNSSYLPGSEKPCRILKNSTEDKKIGIKILLMYASFFKKLVHFAGEHGKICFDDTPHDII